MLHSKFLYCIVFVAVSCFRWIEACINEPLPLTVELEEGLMNGVYLAKLGHFMAPDLVPLKKVFDSDQSRYRVRIKIFCQAILAGYVQICATLANFGVI